MTDEKKRSLENVLRELHEILDGSPELGEEGRDSLRQAADEISLRLGDRNDADDAATGESLGDRLRDSLERFEGNHPKLTGVVGRIADALSELGI